MTNQPKQWAIHRLDTTAWATIEIVFLGGANVFWTPPIRRQTWATKAAAEHSMSLIIKHRPHLAGRLEVLEIDT